MAIAINEQQTGTATTGTTVTPTAFGTAPSTSELIIVCLGGALGTSWSGPGTGPSFTFIAAATDSTACNETIGWALGDGSTTSFTFTEAGATGDPMVCRIMRVSGLDLTGANELATFAESTTAATSAAVSPGTSTVADELWVINANLASAATAPSGGLFTNGYSAQSMVAAVNGSGEHAGVLVGTRIVSATGSTNSTVSWTGSEEYDIGFVAFKGAAAGAPVPKGLVVSQALNRAGTY